MGIVEKLRNQFVGTAPVINQPAVPLQGEDRGRSSEIGFRTTVENQTKYLYRQMWVDPDLRQAILDIREADRIDGRVKKIHNKMARFVVKGGLKLVTSSENKRIISAWDLFQRRTELNKPQKLESDARGLVMEGNLPLQNVLTPDGRIDRLIRMPSETLVPNVSEGGRYNSVDKAWKQVDGLTGTTIAEFALWQLIIVRLTPDNYDDMGSLGRPYLDSNRTVFKKLLMTEEDLVIRRRTRAPSKYSHVLEGADEKTLQDYIDRVESDKHDVATDFYQNKAGGVSAVQGDANLDQIADVSYLLDTFFAGSPAPKGLFGYVGDLNRDILEDLKKDFFEEIDAIQDLQAEVYEKAFRIDLLLQGINPNRVKFSVQFAQRRTETRNQGADLALKYKAVGIPDEMVWETAGFTAADVLEQRAAERKSNDPYPDDDDIPEKPAKVSITPGNAPKGESATSISNE